MSITDTRTSVTVYGVVVTEATSTDAWNARLVLERKMSALSTLAGDLIHEASIPFDATTPEQAVIAHAKIPAPDADRVSLIERECKNLEGSIRNALATRKAHPSYGYTKAGIADDIARLVGLGQALAILTGVGTTDSAGRSALDALGISLGSLRTALKAA